MGVETSIYAGVARRDITPEVGVDLSGYAARDNPSTGLHDPLFAKSLCLKFGEERFVLVCADLVALHRDSVRRIREAALQRTGIPSTHLLLTTTHTHSGVATVPLRHCGTPDPKVVEKIEDSIIETVVESTQDSRKARIGFGRTRVKAPLFFNRRDPEHGPVDDELIVLRVDDEEGKPLASWVNFACHAVVLPGSNTDISADFPGAVTRHVESSRGGTALFSNGACGDINPYHGGFDDVDNMGRSLADAALKAMEDIPMTDKGALSIQWRELTLEFAPLATREQLEQIRDPYQKMLENAANGTEKRVALAHLDYVRDASRMLEKGEQIQPLKVDLKAIRINDEYLVSFPGEVLVTIGKEIKRAAPGKVAFIGYADGCSGYIPMKPDYEKGGYEPSGAWVFYGYNAPFVPGIGELVIQEAAQLIEKESNNNG